MCIFRALQVNTIILKVLLCLKVRTDRVLFSYILESFKQHMSDTLYPDSLFILFQPDRNIMKPFPLDSLHYLTNRLKVNVSASSRMLHVLQRLERKQCSKIKGEEREVGTGFVLADSLKTQSFYPGAAVTIVV